MKRREIVTYAGREVFVGVDVHKVRYAVSCVSGGQLMKRCQMVAQPQVLKRFLLSHFAEAKITVGYEAGFSAYGLHRELESAGIRCLVVNPSSIEVSSRDRVKTDKRDSLKIAEQLAAGRLRSVYIPSERQERQRLLSRTRSQLVKERTRIRNQIRFKLHQFGLIEVEHRAELSRKLVCEVIRSTDNQELKLVLQMLIDLWESIDRRCKRLDQELKHSAGDKELFAYYRSAPGVGDISARVLLNELGDMSQFPNERALFSYTGLTPAEYSSGERRKLGHISRQGNGRVRGVLCECAWTAIKRDEELRSDFERIAHRAGRKRAIVAVARKLIGRIRAAIKRQEPFRVMMPVAA